MATDLVGGIGSGTSYDFAFRAFASMPYGTYQMFFDLTAMQALYGTGAGNIFPGASGIGTIGSDFRVALNGLGNNDVTFGVNTAVPEPSTYLAGALLLLPFGLSMIRRLRKSRTA